MPLNLKRFHWSKAVRKGRETAFSHVVVDGQEEYEMEEILRYKAKGAWLLYLVMWKGYPITEAS